MSETLKIEKYDIRNVVTCFLLSQGEVLLLRRSEKVGTYRGMWAGVSGYIEGDPDEQAYKEISEEVGLKPREVQLVRKGESLRIPDDTLRRLWIVHPYLFRVTDRDKLRLDWEHVEWKWISPAEIDNFETVPKLKETLQQVL